MSNPCSIIKKEIGNLFTCSEFKGFIRISTPFLYPDRDVVEIFYKELEGGFVLTDFGEAFRWLESRSTSGMINKKQKEILEEICNSSQLKFNGEMIIGRFTNKVNISEAIMQICQAIKEITSLWVLQPGRNIKNIIDVVEEFIKGLNISYERGNKFTGSITEKVWHPHFLTISKENLTLTHVLHASKKGQTRNIISYVNAQWQDLEEYKNQNHFKFISLIIDTKISEDNDNNIWTSGDEKFLKRTSVVQKWSNKNALKTALIKA